MAYEWLSNGLSMENTMLSLFFWFCLGSVVVLLNALFSRLGQLAVITLKQAKRVAILIIGVSVVLVGIALIFLPGPAFVVIPAGLAILAVEFVWARRILVNIKNRAKALFDTVVGEHNADPSEGDKLP